MYYVYTLADPRDNEVFYVGITNNIGTRFQAHMNLQGNNPEKNARIQRLQEENVTPHIEVIEALPDETTALVRERYWIDYYSQQGLQLTNIRQLKKVVSKRSSQQNSKYPVWANCYTEKQAAKTLGVSIEVFHRLIQEGRVRQIFLPVLKKPVYSRFEIDIVAYNLRA